MFKSGKDIKGGCYLEFQFCGAEAPVKDGKTDADCIVHWLDDSLVMDDDDFQVFYQKYQRVLTCALFPNGDTGFDGCGVNYYDARKTENMLCTLKPVLASEYAEWILWLEEAVRKGKGFYILGV